MARRQEILLSFPPPSRRIAPACGSDQAMTWQYARDFALHHMVVAKTRPAFLTYAFPRVYFPDCTIDLGSFGPGWRWLPGPSWMRVRTPSMTRFTKHFKSIA